MLRRSHEVESADSIGLDVLSPLTNGGSSRAAADLIKVCPLKGLEVESKELQWATPPNT